MAKDISAYIRELLFRHDCVIIPGFGAFIGNYFHSRIDRKEGLFYPPSRKITFNRHLTGNDGLLIGHVSSRLGTGYAEARDKVNTWSEDLKRRIMAGNNVMLEHLGIFSLNHDGVIIFEPDTSVNYLLSSYGLTSYQRQPVSDYDIRKKVLGRKHEPAVSEPSIRRLITRAAVIIPVIVALSLVPFNDHLFRGRIEESTLNPLARAELEYNREQITAETRPSEAVVADSTAPVVQEDATVQTPFEATAPAPNVREVLKPAVVVHEYRYLLIIGSFQGEENALGMMDILRKKGYDPEMTAGPEGFIRVGAVSFETLEEARAALPTLLSEYPGTWIHKVR